MQILVEEVYQMLFDFDYVHPKISLIRLFLLTKINRSPTTSTYTTDQFAPFSPYKLKPFIAPNAALAITIDLHSR